MDEYRQYFDRVVTAPDSIMRFGVDDGTSGPSNWRFIHWPYTGLIVLGMEHALEPGSTIDLGDTFTPQHLGPIPNHFTIVRKFPRAEFKKLTRGISFLHRPFLYEVIND